MRDFYQKVLPASGVYCAAGFTNGEIRNVFAESLDDLLTQIKNLTRDGTNIFVAPGSFKNYSRRADNSLAVKSFFVDLDVGSNKGYESQDAALRELDAFVERVGLPPPVRVNSGNGIHAYWVFDQDVPTAEWRPYAKKFKQFCHDNGLRIDPVVTADAARIMRCPGTFNYKSDPPVCTGVIDEDIHEYSWPMFKEFLGEVEPETPDALPSVLSNVERGLDDDTKTFRKFDSYETLFSTIAIKSLNDEGCAQIKHILVNAATLSEPEWYAGLSIARQCDDWETAIHAMSEGHPGYTFEKTLRKANQTAPTPEKPDGSPRSCEAFAADWPERCEGCVYKGRYRNPLPIGRRVKEATLDDKSGEDAPEIAFGSVSPVPPKPAKYPPLPKELLPFTRSAKGEIFYTPPPVAAKDGKTIQDPPLLLFEHDFYPIKRMYSSMDGECLLMRFVPPHDAAREFLLPTSSLSLTDRFKEVIGKQGILFTNPQHIPLIMNYVTRWGKFLINANSAEQMRMQMGWTEDGNGFIIGETEIHRDGTVAKAAASPFVKNITKSLRVMGSYDVWRTSAAALANEHFEQHAFGLMIGFGSPLMRFTSTSGANICFTGKSGFAKTGALYGAISIWGQPKDLSVFDATENGMITRYLGLKNILLACDEVSNKPADKLSNLIHRVSHGKGKIRMQASVNAERESEMSAALICFMTSNQSIYDKLTELKTNPDGEVARMIEFMLFKPKPLDDDPELGKKIFNPFNFNYGHAGIEFVKHCFTRGDDYITALIDKWHKRFITDFGADTAYRFYENVIAAIFAGGELANEAGIINYDLDRIFNVVMTHLLAIKNETIQVNYADYPAMIAEFVQANQDKMLIINGDKITYEPRISVWMRSEIQTETLYISATELRKYLSSLKVSSAEFLKAVTSQGLLTFRGKKRLTSGWKAGISVAPISVYGFRYELPDDVIRERLAASKSED